MNAAQRLLALLVAGALSCAGVDDTGRPNGPLTVVATCTIVADIARHVAGPRAEVRSLLPPGVDAHVYQPTPADVAAIAAADVVIVNGLGFEGWIDQVVRQSGYRGQVVVASAGVTPLPWTGDHATPDQVDPHAWQDVANGMVYAQAIRDGLSAADPAGAGDYAALTVLYAAQLRALDAWVRKQVATLPERSRLVVTSHDALRYFGVAYGIEIHAVEGIVTGHEPDPGRIAALISLVRERAVRAVFIENVANPAVVERVAAESGARLGGSLYTDSLGAPESAGGTYSGMIAANTRTIVAGLAGRP